jgi:hypothetical protein
VIHRISLAEVLDQVSPPAKTLDISVIDDTAFVRVCDVREDHRNETHRQVVEIKVGLASLVEALNLLAVDAGRERLRPAGRHGVYETRLAGRRLTVAPVGLWSAVGALTEHLRYEEPAEDPPAEPPAGP